jgi:hypothetical protein
MVYLEKGGSEGEARIWSTWKREVARGRLGTIHLRGKKSWPPSPPPNLRDFLHLAFISSYSFPCKI